MGNRVFDRMFGIHTAGTVEVAALGFEPSNGLEYVPSNWVNLIGFLRMVRAMDIGAGDVFLDLGCGKGQVVFLAARLPFDRVIGLDLSESMISIARRNLDPNEHSFKAQRVDLIVGDAADYEIPDDVNVCYLYNPFPRPIMEKVMAHMDASLIARPRRLHVLYLQPADRDLLIAHGFREVRRIRRLRQYVRDPGAGDRPEEAEPDDQTASPEPSS